MQQLCVPAGDSPDPSPRALLSSWVGFLPFSIWFSLPLSSAALGPSFPCQSIHPVLG